MHNRQRYIRRAAQRTGRKDRQYTLCVYGSLRSDTKQSPAAADCIGPRSIIPHSPLDPYIPVLYFLFFSPFLSSAETVSARVSAFAWSSIHARHHALASFQTIAIRNNHAFPISFPQDVAARSPSKCRENPSYLPHLSRYRALPLSQRE